MVVVVVIVIVIVIVRLVVHVNLVELKASNENTL